MIGLRSVGLFFSEPGALESSLYLYLLRWQMRVMTQVGTLEEQGHRRQRACTFIFTGTPLPSQSQACDEFIWMVEDDPLSKFSASRTWADSIWFKSCTPRHAFLMWIAQHDRMPSRARLFNCGLCTTPNCCLCYSAPESRDHLLLRCEVSVQI